MGLIKKTRVTTREFKKRYKDSGTHTDKKKIRGSLMDYMDIRSNIIYNLFH